MDDREYEFGVYSPPCGPPEPDPYMETDRVVGLNYEQFNDYVGSKDITLVLFYHHKNSEFYMKNLKKASKITKRCNHAFATVDCVQEFELCLREKVPTFPYYKIYAKGKDIGFNTDPSKFLFKDMKKWVEGYPVD